MSDITIIDQPTALAVFTDSAQFSVFYDKVKAEVDQIAIDLTTAAGRDIIKAAAFKVTKTKTAIEAAGKALTEEWRKQTAVVTSARTKMVADLDALAKEVRRPLTDWEAAEKARTERITARINELRQSTFIAASDTADDLRARLLTVVGTHPIDPEEFGDAYDIAISVRDQAIETLDAAIVRLDQAERDAAELARLRAEAAQAAEKAAADAAALQAKQDADEAQARAAADQAAREQDIRDRAARTAQDAADATHRAQIAAVQAKADAALADAQARAATAERAERDRLAQVAADKAADDARAADQVHRRRVNVSVRDALIKTVPELTVVQAETLTRAIALGEIPNVRMTY